MAILREPMPIGLSQENWQVHGFQGSNLTSREGHVLVGQDIWRY